MKRILSPPQSGMVLVISLIFLLLLTILSISVIQTANLEEKMAANLQNKHIVFQLAEVELRQQEQWIKNQVNSPTAAAVNPGPNAVWQKDMMDADPNDGIAWWLEQDDAWWQANGISLAPAIANLPSPKSIIEFIHKQQRSGEGNGGSEVEPFLYYYRITTRATGNNNEQILLQSITAQEY